MVARVSNCKKWCLAGLLGMIRQAAAAGNVTIFNLGEDFQPFKYSFMMTVVLAGLLVFDELVVEKIEHHLRHTSIFHVDLFNKTLKELMILGLISFSLFIIKDNTLVEDGSTFYNPSAIEFVKLFLFFMGVSFVLAAMALARFTGPIKERYDKYANTKLEVLVKKHNNMVEKTWWYYTTHPFTYTNEVVNKQIVKSFDFGWKSWLLSIILVFLTLLFIPHVRAITLHPLFYRYRRQLAIIPSTAK